MRVNVRLFSGTYNEQTQSFQIIDPEGHSDV